MRAAVTGPFRRVLGTDDQPGSGVLNLTFACQEIVAVPAGVQAMSVSVSFGPTCSIETTAAARS